MQNMATDQINPSHLPLQDADLEAILTEKVQP